MCHKSGLCISVIHLDHFDALNGETTVMFGSHVKCFMYLVHSLQSQYKKQIHSETGFPLREHFQVFKYS